MNALDSSAWLSYLRGDANPAEFAKAVEDLGQSLVPSITLAEVFKSVLRRNASNYAILNRRRSAIPRCADPKAKQPIGEDANAVLLDNLSLMEGANERIYSSYKVGWWQPCPGPFRFAMSESGSQPIQCVVVEDSEVGIRSSLGRRLRLVLLCSR